ncbi:AraC family transcriptional regulator [Danxiaibacter flavus]|uniref:AraC family transcriptional regulator n=1 Tax=Danxiaibacter flavus TaxID=3049108 RepID=A0ABV3ZDA6_9BACT|nr:AraC family transcriptional regulator [Chitinophagaceae bacterium DXS]
MKPAHTRYLTEVDKIGENIYCDHDFVGRNAAGENHVPTHKHVKGQFLYTEGGIVHITTDEKNYFLPARHYMWIPPGKLHSITTSSPDVMMRNLYFPPPEKEADFYRQIAIYPVNDLLLEMLFFTRRWHGQIPPENDVAYSFIHSIKAILPEISSYSLPLSLPYPKSERLLQLVRYLYQHIDEDIRFATLARQFGYSERTLARVFQQELNMSFVQFFTLQRMMKALQLLLEEKRTVNETAYMVGYNSVPTFSNTFHKIIGTRPSEYMKQKGVRGIIEN